MCVSIHLECWLDKIRVEIVTWAAVGVTRIQQQFQFQKFSSVNVIDVDLICIQCASSVCEFNSHSNRIKCERAFLNIYMGCYEADANDDYYKNLNLSSPFLY